MKIAIFGDSYGSEKELFKVAGLGKIRHNEARPWVEIFRELAIKNGLARTVVNYSLSGSSMYYSYDRYLRHCDEYDRVIFICTVGNRLTKMPPYKENDNYDYDDAWVCSNYEHAIMYQKSPDISEEYRKFLKSAVTYYSYIHDPIQDSRMWDLMFNRIRSDTRTFLMQSMDVPRHIGNTLYNITREEEKVYDGNRSYLDRMSEGIVDMRYNHITGIII